MYRGLYIEYVQGTVIVLVGRGVFSNNQGEPSLEIERVNRSAMTVCIIVYREAISLTFPTLTTALFVTWK
jgi:hypothetical protein